MTKIPNPKPFFHLEDERMKPVSVFGYWNLGFVWNLVLGIWDFSI
jgi:hypothetical protein